MGERKLLTEPSDVKALADRLYQLAFFARMPDSLRQEKAWGLAHALSDLEQSLRVLLDAHFPRLLLNDAARTDLTDVLLDMGEEFRHILYHLNDASFYSYLTDQDPPSQPKAP